MSLSPAQLYNLIQRHHAIDPAGLRVDLGCGYYKPPGFIGIDDLRGKLAQLENSMNPPDIFMDLNRDAIPLPDESCIEVRASHFLEHANVPHILDEVYRLLKPSGIFLFTVPYANSAEGMYPGHSIFFTEKWFHNNLQCQALFEIEEERYRPSDIYDRLPESIRAIPFDIARQIFFNVCCEMTMRARTKRRAGGAMTG